MQVRRVLPRALCNAALFPLSLLETISYAVLVIETKPLDLFDHTRPSHKWATEHATDAANATKNAAAGIFGYGAIEEEKTKEKTASSGWKKVHAKAAESIEKIKGFGLTGLSVKTTKYAIGALAFATVAYGVSHYYLRSKASPSPHSELDRKDLSKVPVLTPKSPDWSNFAVIAVCLIGVAAMAFYAKQKKDEADREKLINLEQQWWEQANVTEIRRDRLMNSIEALNMAQLTALSKFRKEFEETLERLAQTPTAREGADTTISGQRENYLNAEKWLQDEKDSIITSLSVYIDALKYTPNHPENWNNMSRFLLTNM